jgi:LysR family glycine cleavage system transcriptional activator
MPMPPLNALRAFEAAGRYENFSRAAEELHVTQGAVSRHVKLLEQHLGIELFRRRPQGLELTGPGRALLPELSASFERITQAAKAVTNQDGEIGVFSTAPTIVTRWLVPHLMEFQERYPEYRVNIGLAHIGLDCFEGAKTRPGGFDSVLFRREALTPVCSPRLLDGNQPLEKPSDLANHVLLHPDVDFYDWRKWLRAAQLGEVDVGSGQTFESMEMAVRAAVGGLGVTSDYGRPSPGPGRTRIGATGRALRFGRQ